MSASSHRRRVLSVPSGAPFLPSFVEALLAGSIIDGFPARDDPMAMSNARIFVPTRRAARALAAELAQQVKAPSVILPQIVPLGAMEDSETQSLFEGDAPAFDRPDVVSEVERRVALAELILAWGEAIRGAISHVENGKIVLNDDEPFLVTASPAHAFHLAGELGALIDEMFIEGIDPKALRKLTPENFDKYWSITLAFLEIAFETWPQHLEERGLEDRAQRQVVLVDQEIERLKSGRASGPQIVIGSTGTNVATARLIATIASLPQGAVVLPGLDTNLDEDSRLALDGAPPHGKPVATAAGHPQAALRKLLRSIGISQDDVVEIGAIPQHVAPRMELFAQSLRPAETTDKWHAWRKTLASDFMSNALHDVTFVEADDEREEAQAIAIALREILETPDETAAFVTPDRALARRVRAELQRWHIEVDDSGGDPLSREPWGILAGLALECASANAGPSALLALLDHAHVRLGLDTSDFARLRTLAEIAVLRGANVSLAGLSQAVRQARRKADEKYAHPAIKAIEDEDWLRLERFFATIDAALLPLRSIAGAQPPRIWFAALRQTMANLTACADDSPVVTANEGAQVFEEIAASFDGLDTSRFALKGDEFGSLFAMLAREAIVRGPRRAHPRIKILGLLEARLLGADHVVLGGLDEAVWPPATKTDAFLNRVMRAELGLSSPERRIGQTAHDFVEAAGARRVVFTRARKREGSPTVPSRFIQRIHALAGDAWKSCVDRGALYLDLARRIDANDDKRIAIGRPEPRPALELRPKGLSITEIETWRRDPYSIYARHILKLLPLEDIEADNFHAEFGTLLHDVLAEFQLQFPDTSLPEDAEDRLLGIAEEKFAVPLDDPKFRTFKWSDVLLSLRTFIAWEGERRSDVEMIFSETSGRLEIPLGDGSVFTLRGRADRIEKLRDGEIAIVDFKTGKLPTIKEIAAGFSPQLTLEGAMIENGAFPNLPAGTKVGEALYVAIGKGEGDKQRQVKSKEKSLAQLVAEHFEGLKLLAEQFRSETTPYLARPMPQYKSRFGEYDHLSRVKEWSADTDGGET